MLIVSHDINGRVQRYEINKPEELLALINYYPLSFYSAMLNPNMNGSAKSTSIFMSSPSTRSWLQNELNKSAKNALTGALMLATALTPSSMHTEPKKDMVQVESQDSFGKKPEDAFLWTVQHLESNDGKNTHHKLITNGASKGQTAIGRYGLLPKTAKEMVTRMMRNKKAPEYLHILPSLNDKEVPQFFKANPQAELEVARAAARHVLGRQKGDYARAGYAWLYGHNLFPKDINDEALQDPYVQKFLRHNVSNPFLKAHKKQSLIKAESPAEAIKYWIKLRNIPKPISPVRGDYTVGPLDSARDEPALEFAMDADKVRAKLKKIINRRKDV
jgi:hypothetical protein